MALTTDPNEVVAQIQKYASTVTSGGVQMRRAPAKPPESTSEFPFAVTWLARVQGKRQSDFLNPLCVYRTQIHLARRDLPADISNAAGYAMAFLKTINENLTLNGLVSTVNADSDGVGVLSFMEYGGVATIGYNFDLSIKMVVALTLS